MEKEAPHEKEETVNEITFEEICVQLRKSKIQLKEAQDFEKIAKERAKEYIETHELKAGNYHGIKVVEAYKFAEDNLDVAKRHKIKVPTKTSFALNLSEQRIKKLISSGVLTADEVVKTETKDMKALEQIFAEKNITGLYTVARSFRLVE
jgi:hypothetical protein